MVNAAPVFPFFAENIPESVTTSMLEEALAARDITLAAIEMLPESKSALLSLKGMLKPLDKLATVQFCMPSYKRSDLCSSRLSVSRCKASHCV